jgi:hypothetical protein
MPDAKRPRMAGMVNEKVTEIGLKVIPFNKEEEKKDLNFSIRPLH